MDVEPERSGPHVDAPDPHLRVHDRESRQAHPMYVPVCELLGCVARLEAVAEFVLARKALKPAHGLGVRTFGCVIFGAAGVSG